MADLGDDFVFLQVPAGLPITCANFGKFPIFTIFATIFLCFVLSSFAFIIVVYMYIVFQFRLPDIIPSHDCEGPCSDSSKRH